MTKKGYITKGISGWTICFWNGRNQVRYLHGYVDWQSAQLALAIFWNNPPDFDRGFSTIVELT